MKLLSKRLFSLMLALVMILGAMPVFAMAQTNDEAALEAHLKDSVKPNITHAGTAAVKVNGSAVTSYHIDPYDDFELDFSCSCDDYAWANWSSSNTSVASLNRSYWGYVTVSGYANGSAVITAECEYCDAVARCTVTVGTYVAISKTSLSLTKGSTSTLTASVQSGQPGETISWSSSNTAVATVSAGTIKAVGAGTATITAKASSGVSATCTVKVTVPSTKVSLSATKISLKPTKTKTLKATISPADSTDTLTWQSSNSKVAKVSAKGVVTAVKPGTATITVKTSGGKTATCKVTVVKVPATKIKFSKSSVSVSMYSTKSLKVTMTPSYSTDKITWTSSNKAVAKVNSKGVVTGVKEGTAIITAKTTSGKKASCKVTVKYKPAVSTKVTYCDDTAIYNELGIQFTNNTNKTIQYMELNITQYDNRGYKLQSPYDYFYVNDYLNPKSSRTWEFWVNGDTKSAKVSMRKVWFTDGTTWTPKK